MRNKKIPQNGLNLTGMFANEKSKKKDLKKPILRIHGQLWRAAESFAEDIDSSLESRMQWKLHVRFGKRR